MEEDKKYWHALKAFEEGRTLRFNSNFDGDTREWNKRGDHTMHFIRKLLECSPSDIEILPTKEERAEQICNEIIKVFGKKKTKTVIENIKKLL